MLGQIEVGIQVHTNHNREAWNTGEPGRRIIDGKREEDRGCNNRKRQR
jgi:hypothetical protein